MEFRVPELGEGVYEAELVAWLVEPGAAIKRGQSLMEVMTDKATFEVPAPFAGVITALHAEPGRQIKVGDPILDYETANSKVAESAELVAEKPAEPSRQGTAKSDPSPAKEVVAEPREALREANGRHSVSPPAETPSVRASPAVRRMASGLGVDLAGVDGTGPEGRVLLDDLTEHVRKSGAAPTRRGEQRSEYGTPGTRLKFVGLRRKVAEHMVEAKHTIPHYSYVDECNVTALVQLRETYRQAGLRVTYLPFFVKAVVAALKQVPIVNASLDEAAGEIVLHDRYDIGIATATAKGLLVPVVRRADQKTVLQLASEIEQLTADARNGEAQREDLQGSTFTITSIGSIGGLISTPIVNHPEVAILGVGKIVKRPVYDEKGDLKPADIVYLSFSFDHRVLDGAIGAAFGNAVISSLQDPALWLELFSTERGNS